MARVVGDDNPNGGSGGTTKCNGNSNGTNGFPEGQNQVKMDSDTDTAHSIDECAESDLTLTEEDIYEDVRTGVSDIDEAMRQLNPTVYPKLTYPNLLLRGLKKDLEFPVKTFPFRELVLDIQRHEDESEKLYQLAMHLIYGKEIDQDLIYAVILLRRVAKMKYFEVDTYKTNHGVGKAQAALAALHILGVGVMQSFFLASFWYHCSLAHGNEAEAGFRIATLYLFGLGTNKNLEKANEHFKTFRAEDPKIENDLLEIYSRTGDFASAKQRLNNLRTSYSDGELESNGIKILSLENNLNSQELKLQNLKKEIETFEGVHRLKETGLTLVERNDRRLRSMESQYEKILSKQNMKQVLSDKYLRYLLHAGLNGLPTAENVLNGEVFGLRLHKLISLKKPTNEEMKLMLSDCYECIPYQKRWPENELNRFVNLLKEDIYEAVTKQKKGRYESTAQDLEMKWRVSIGYVQVLMTTPDENEKKLELFLKQTVERYPTEKAAYQVITLYYNQRRNFTASIEYTLEGLKYHPQDLHLLCSKACSLYHLSISNIGAALSEQRRSTYEAVRACEDFLRFAPLCCYDNPLILDYLRHLHATFLEETIDSGKDSLTWKKYCVGVMVAHKSVKMPDGLMNRHFEFRNETLRMMKKKREEDLRITNKSVDVNNTTNKT